MNHRLQEFDIIRVTAAFAVIAIHITAGYVTATSLAFALNQLVRFAVPLFIIISGFLLYYQDSRKNIFSLSNFYLKRFSRIIWPYLIWTIIYFIIGIILSGVYLNWWNALAQIARHLLWGTACYHLYFMVIVFQLYLLYPFLRTCMQKWPQIILIIALVLTVFSQTLLYFDMMNIVVLPRQYQSFYLVAFPVWIFYFVLGMYIALYHEQIQIRLSGWFWPIIILWCFSLVLLFIDSRLTGTYATSMRPSVIFYTVATYFLLYGLSHRLHTRVGSWLSWLSQQSFLIFLMHPLFLTGLIYLDKYLGAIWEGNIGMVRLYLSTTVLTLGAVWVLSFTSLAPYLGGTRLSLNLHKKEVK